jgi:hypothetical protein
LDSPEAWVGAVDQKKWWVIRHSQGLKRIDLETGEARDVLQIAEDKLRGNRGRLISSDGTTFAYSTDGETAIFARVEGGDAVTRASARELFGLGVWPPHTFVSHEGSYCICMDRPGRTFRVSRVNLLPKPEIVASYDLGPLPHDVGVGPGKDGWVVTVPSAPGGGGGRLLRCFDDRL